MDDERKEILSIEINACLAKWKEEFGATPGDVVSPDTFLMNVALHSVIAYLQEKDLLDAEEFDIVYKQTMLRELQETLELARNAKRQALVSKLVPRMDIPRGGKH